MNFSRFLMFVFLISTFQIHTLNLELIHIADSHSHISPEFFRFKKFPGFDEIELRTRVAGYPRIIEKIKRARNINPDLLVFHGGDSFQGTLYFQKFRENTEPSFLNLMKLDGFTLGNHEFDLEESALLGFLNKINFPVLGGNILCESDSLLKNHILPYKTFYRDGIKISVAGISTPQTPLIACPPKNIQFQEPEFFVKEWMEKCEKENIHHRILLSHCGLDKNQELADLFPEIDIIISSHTHDITGKWDVLGIQASHAYPLVIKKENHTTLILANWKNLLCINSIQVKFDSSGKIVEFHGSPQMICSSEWEYRPLDKSSDWASVSKKIYDRILKEISKNKILVILPEDNEASAILSEMKPEIDILKKKIIGFSKDNLLHIRIPGSRHDSGKILPQGSELAPVIADILQWKSDSLNWNADGVFINSGSIKKDLLAGDISYGDILEILPYPNYLCMVEVTGKNLLDTFNHGLDQALSGTEDGALPYTAKIRFRIDYPQRKALDIEFLINHQWEKIDLNKTYKIATYSYLADGGNGFDKLNLKDKDYLNSGVTYSEIFMEYLEKNPQPLYSKPLLILP